MRGRLQGVFTVVVAGGPRLGDLRAGVTAVVLSASLSWTVGGVACAIIVATAAPLVRTFWTYDAGSPPDDAGSGVAGEAAGGA